MKLINFDISLNLMWSKNCAITSKATQDANPAVAAVNKQTGATLAIADGKLFVPVVTLSTQDDIKFFQQLKTGFK